MNIKNVLPFVTAEFIEELNKDYYEKQNNKEYQEGLKRTRELFKIGEYDETKY